MTRIAAMTFDEALKEWTKTADADIDQYIDLDGSPTFWGCQLFDNETDARNNFG